MKVRSIRAAWLVVAALGAAAAFAALFWMNSANKVEELPETPVASLDDWTLESSSLNGAPLEENKRIYDDLDYGRVDTVYITVFPTYDGNGNEMKFTDFEKATARDKTFNPVLDANFQVGGEDGTINPLVNTDTPNATIQLRGNSSRGAVYKSYKVKLKDDVQDFYGQTILNINKHVGDVSKVTNKFCMDLMQPMEDMASFRTYFMYVYIRDASLPKEEQEFKYYGLYTEIEQPNKTYLRQRGLDTNGQMYKANNFEFRLTPELKNIDDPGYDEEAFETVLGIREAKNHTKLLQMLEDVNDISQDFNEVFHRYFNEDNYLTWMACNVLLGNEDTIAHNFIIYSPQDSLTWYFIPWDYDGTFKFGEYRSSYQVPESLQGVRRMSGVLLHRRYLLQPGNQDKLTEKMEEILQTAFTKERVDFLLNAYKPVMAEALQRSPDLELLEIPLPDYNAYLDQFYEQIQLNYQNYLNSNKYSLPFFVSEPEKNSNGTYHFTWEPSYSPQGRIITYTFRLGRDMGLQDLVYEESGLQQNYFDAPAAIPPGQYYLAVTATDSEGNEQISLDFYYNALDLKNEVDMAEYIRNGSKRQYFGLRAVTLE